MRFSAIKSYLLLLLRQKGEPLSLSSWHCIMKNNTLKDMTSQKNDSFSVIWKELSKCKRVAMSLHARPDGDSLGSCCA